MLERVCAKFFFRLYNLSLYLFLLCPVLPITLLYSIIKEYEAEDFYCDSDS